MKRFSMAMTWLALAGLMTTVSCRKPVVGFTNGESRTVTVSAVTESGGGSKTSIDGLNVKWSEGDVISMNGSEMTLKEGAGTTKGVFEGTVTGTGPYYVGYPAEYISYVAAPLSFSINIPASWTYDVAKQIVPMVAVTNSVEGGLQFHNAVNMLKMQLKGDGTAASKLKSIVLTSTTSNLNGKINVTFNGETPEFAAIADGDGASKTMTVNFGEEGLQLTTDATTDVYIPLAKIDGGDLTVRFNCANGKYMEKTIKVGNYEAFNDVNNVLDVDEEVEVEGETEPSYLPSEFSVANGKKVQFSRGNLRYENGNFVFADKQWTYNTTWSTTDCGHFYWSSDVTTAVAERGPSSISLLFTNSDETTSKPGFKVNGEEGWRVLSKAEWTYLLNPGNASSGARQGNRFAKARLNDTDGLIIFPDGYDGTTSDEGIATVNNCGAGYPVKNIPDDTWKEMVKVGVVFLPVSGYRSDSGTVSIDSNISGIYWSSNNSSSSAIYRLIFTKKDLTTDKSSINKSASTVRLVRDVK